MIDIESLHYLLQRAYPVHRFFHTFLGATIAGVVVGATLVGLRRVALNAMPKAMAQLERCSPSLKAELSNVGLVVGSLIGGVSHPLLDGIMHRDIRPFAPWSDANPLLGLIGLDALHVACLLLGVAGMIIVGVRLYRESPTNIEEKRSE